MDVIAFYVFAAIAVVASLLVIGQRNPMHSVMLLIVSFGALSGLYVLLDAPFTAVTQIIVYAGAIMVLFLFVVMLLNAVNLTFVAVGRFLNTVDGQIITFFVMTVAAAEAAVGLALVIALFRHRETLSPDAFTALKW